MEIDPETRAERHRYRHKAKKAQIRLAHYLSATNLLAFYIPLPPRHMRTGSVSVPLHGVSSGLDRSSGTLDRGQLHLHPVQAVMEDVRYHSLVSQRPYPWARRTAPKHRGLGLGEARTMLERWQVFV